jgi:hypothetical protein
MMRGRDTLEVTEYKQDETVTHSDMIPNLSKNTEKTGCSFAKDGSYCFIKKDKSSIWRKSNFSELRKLQ